MSAGCANQPSFVSKSVRPSPFTSPIALQEPAGASSRARRLTDYELACRLSYFLWSSMPDDELLDAAAAAGDEVERGVDGVLLGGRPKLLGRERQVLVVQVDHGLHVADHTASDIRIAIPEALVEPGRPRSLYEPADLVGAGDLAGGIWFAFIGWFLVQAARASYQELQLRELLRGVEAEEVMAADLVRIPPELSLQAAVDDYFMRYDHGGFPVEEQGRTVGLLTLRGVRRVPREQWPSRRVREHMVPLGDQVVVAPDARMDGVLAKLEDGEAGRVLVVQDGEVVGIITPTDLTRWLRRWRTLDTRAR